MTHPTGEHTKGVELAAGYVSVAVRVEKALDQLKTDLKGVEAQAETSALAARTSLMTHLGGAGKPVTEQLTKDLSTGLAAGAEQASMSWRDKFWSGFLGSSGVSVDASKAIGATMASRVASGFTDEIAAQGSIARPIATALRGGVAAAEADAGASGHRLGGKLLTGFAGALEGSSGLAASIGPAMSNLRSELETGSAAAFGAFEEHSKKAAAGAKTHLAGIGGAAMGLVSGPMAALVAAGTTAAGAFEVIKGGFDRLESIEEFTKRLDALGFSTQQTKALLAGLDEATRNTQFRMPQVMDVGERALQQNPNMSQTQIANYIKTLEDASASSGKIDINGLGRFIDKIQTLGSLSMPRQLATLATDNLPIAAWVKKDLGLTDDEFQKFIKDKKLTYSVFMDELQKNTAGGAAKMADTYDAQKSIMGDNINRVGGDLVAPFFGQAGGLMQNINKGLSGVDADLAKPQAQATIKHVGDMVEGGIKDVFNAVKSIFGDFTGGKSIGAYWKQITSAFSEGTGGMKMPNFQEIFKDLKPVAGYFINAIKETGQTVIVLAKFLGMGVKAIEIFIGGVDKGAKALADLGRHTADVVMWFIKLPGELGKAIEGVGGAIINAFTNVFSGIHLPHWLGGAAHGGILQSFAVGGLPGAATIQKPVGSHGLVQWAEPSTGGEAFIPLSGGQRSQEIWMETGRRLGLIESYAPGGVRGSRHATPSSGDDESRVSKVLGVLDKFSDHIDKVHKSFTGFSQAIDKIKGGDTGGGLDGLTKSVKDLAPVAKDLKEGLQGAKDALPDSVSMPGMPSIGKPSIGSLRGSLKNLDHDKVSRGTQQAQDTAERIDDMIQNAGGSGLPGLGGITEGVAGTQEANEAHGHLQNVIQAIKEGKHNEALEHGADLVNVAGSLGKRFGIDNNWTEPVNQAVGLQWMLQGAGKSLSVAAKGLGARALPGVLGKAPGMLGTLGEGLAGELAAPVAIGAIAGKGLSDFTMGHNIGGYGDKVADTYDDQGEAKNPVERWMEHAPILSWLKPSDDIRNRNKNRKAEADAIANRPWDQADNSMLLDPEKHAPKPVAPSDMTQAATSVGGVSDEDMAALGGYASGGFAGLLPGNSLKDNLLGMIPGKRIFGLAGGEGVIKTAIAQSPIGKMLVRWMNGGMKGYAGGGESVSGYDFVSSMEGTPYSQGARDDCSGMASQVINSFLGLPPRSSMFTTQTEGGWLKAHGFVMGDGPPGTLRVGWYNHGSAPNDGHTALTLPDGTPVESGGSHGNFLSGGGAAGASASEFDQHAYLPVNKLQGSPVGGVGSTAAGGIGGSGGGSGGVGGGGTGGGSGGSGSAYSPQGAAAALGAAGFSAASENLPPGFSNPMDWGAVKSGAALFKFLGAVGKQQGNQGMASGMDIMGSLLGGDASGVVSDISSLGAFGSVGIGSPQDASTLAPANLSMSAGSSLPYAGQGEAVTQNVDQSTHFHGDIHDPDTTRDGVKHAKARQQLPPTSRGSG